MQILPEHTCRVGYGSRAVLQLGMLEGALATLSLVHTLEEGNLERPPPVCAPRSEYGLAFLFLAAVLALVSRGEGIQPLGNSLVPMPENYTEDILGF